MPLLAAYTASKAALESFSGNLALEVEPSGVRVQLVLPGRAPETPFGATARARSQSRIPDAYADWTKQVFSAAAQASGDVTSAIDVAEAVWRAATDPAAPFRMPAGADAVALAGGGRAR